LRLIGEEKDRISRRYREREREGREGKRRVSRFNKHGGVNRKMKKGLQWEEGIGKSIETGRMEQKVARLSECRKRLNRRDRSKARERREKGEQGILSVQKMKKESEGGRLSAHS